MTKVVQSFLYININYAYIKNVGISFPASEHTKDYSFVSFSDIIITRGDSYMSDKTFLTIDGLITNIKFKNIYLKNEDNVRLPRWGFSPKSSY